LAREYSSVRYRGPLVVVGTEPPAESDIAPVVEAAFGTRVLTLVEVKASLSTILPTRRS